MKITKCVNCGATLTSKKCSYCNVDYSFQLDFAKQISQVSDPKIKGYYKILDTAFNSGDYDESLQYANKIIEIDPENKEIWGVKIYSSLNKMTIVQFESGNAITLLSQLVNTTPNNAYKILDTIFNISIDNLKYNYTANCAAMIDNACACLDRGIRERDTKVKILISAINARGTTSSSTYTGLQNKTAILNNIKNKYVLPYLSDEEKEKRAKSHERQKKTNKVIIKIVIIGIVALILFVVGIGVYNQFIKSDVIKKNEVFNISFEEKLKISFDESANDWKSPDIYIYTVIIKGDTSQLENAIIEKAKSEPDFTGAYYFFENQEYPVIENIKGLNFTVSDENNYLIKVPKDKDNWKDVFEFIESYKPVASTDADGSRDHQKFYCISDTSGNLVKIKKL